MPHATKKRYGLIGEKRVLRNAGLTLRSRPRGILSRNYKSKNNVEGNPLERVQKVSSFYK